MPSITYICCGKVGDISDLSHIKKKLMVGLPSFKSQQYINALSSRAPHAANESLSALYGLLNLCEIAMLDTQSLSLIRDKNQKPHFENSNYKISLSHSGGLYACALSTEEIGIDIETKKYENYRAKAIAKRFFCHEEFEFVSLCPQKNFSTVWTRKEAYVKMCGSTMPEQINKFNTQSSRYNFFGFEYCGGMVSLCSPLKCKIEIYTL